MGLGEMGQNHDDVPCCPAHYCVLCVCMSKLNVDDDDYESIMSNFCRCT